VTAGNRGILAVLAGMWHDPAEAGPLPCQGTCGTAGEVRFRLLAP
jgi:hypothetical protein